MIKEKVNKSSSAIEIRRKLIKEKKSKKSVKVWGTEIKIIVSINSGIELINKN